MIKSNLLSFILVIVGGVLSAQAPLGFSFQTIIRDSEGKVQKNQSVNLRFSVLEGSESGSNIYSETHSKTTNEFGVINLTVGTGTPLSGSFSSIVWGSNIHFLKTEIDPTGGTTYSISTVSQLMSVPYAMYATQADTVLKVPDTSPTNEIQVLSISNDTIYLSDGGFAKLPPDEPQNLSVSKSGDTLYLSGGNHIILPGITLANYPPIDIDGNVYDTVQIGTQLWMKSNLKTTKYNDGTVIPNVIDITTWMGLSTGARTYYDNDSSTYASTYGALYNWFAVNTGKLCPIGWHVPTDEEWTVLTEFLGGADVAGGKMKTTGTEYWNAPNEGATNESGFNGLPGGMLTSLGFFIHIRFESNWWSTSELLYASDWDWSRVLKYNDGNTFRYGYNKRTGISVRCLKN